MAGLRRVLHLIIVLALAGCATSPPSRFYLLTPVDAVDQKPALENLVLGVGPVRLADYLERPQIVGRESANRLKVEEFNRWGGTLEANINRVVAENLSRRLGIESVVTYPWERALEPDYQVAIDIREFELVRLGEVRLTALWRILGKGGEPLHVVKKSNISEPVSSAGFDFRVAAQSMALARMSEEIAQAVRQLQNSRN